jgi:hypothetical protein
MTFFLKNVLNHEMFNGTPKTLVPSNEVVNWDGVLKLCGKVEGDHVAHFL